jgi:hypothetical protein
MHLRKGHRVILTFALLSSVLGVSAHAVAKQHAGAETAGQQKSAQQKKALIDRIRSLPSNDVPSIDPVGLPLHIVSASSREIPKLVFREITGEASHQRTMSTYPEITLVNTSQKTITGFTILMKNNLDSMGHAIVMKRVSIAPGATYLLPSAKWPKPEKVTTERDGKFVSVVKIPGLDSPKAWLPGSASDSKVVVGMVTFSDGTTWTVSDDPRW